MELFAQLTRAQLAGLGFEQHRATVLDQPFSWWQKGEGPPLVLIHGVNDQAGTWFQVAGPLAESHRLYLVDLPGHGESGPADGPLPMSTVLGGFEGWLLHHVPADAVLVGNSMGAWIAALVAHRQPDRIARVVLVNGGPARPNTGELDLLPRNREQARRLVAALRDESSPPTPDAVLDDLVRRVPTSQVARMLEASADLEDHFLDRRLHELGVAVDLLWGESDRYLGQDYARRLAARLPRARLRWVPDCGHLPQAECPVAFSEGLRTVLDQEPPPRPTHEPKEDVRP